MDVRKSLDKPKAVKRRGNGTSVEEFLLPHVAAKKSACGSKFSLTWQIKQEDRREWKMFYITQVLWKLLAFLLN